MKIFVLDTSSKAASAAVWEDGHLLADCWQNTGRTHSVTSLPMAENLLADCSRTLEEMDALAVTAGPGSFTGLRIGMAMVKGMGFALGKPCIPLSTLEGLAWNLRGWPGLICPVMDARVGQVYTALFRWENGKMHRLMDDCAIAADELREHLAEYGAEPKILVGDGAMLCYNKFEGQLENLICCISGQEPWQSWRHHCWQRVRPFLPGNWRRSICGCPRLNGSSSSGSRKASEGL